MPLKTSIQIIILIIIFIILGGMYFKYFAKQSMLISDTDEITNNTTPTNSEKQKNLKNLNNKKNYKNNIQTETKTVSVNTRTQEEGIEKQVLKSNRNNYSKDSTQNAKNEIPNIVKDVEYITTDNNGNKYKILSTSGKTNQNDTNKLDLENVKGEITSDERSTIYIVSDFAEYDSSTLGSKFYSNVIINFEDKEITCENFDINMDTNIAIAYNNVVVTDPKSIMKAGKITLNIETKEININPANKKTKVQINKL